ncbi:peptidoglycan-binding protein [Saccharothrix xinjiangensis]|uniref:Peptidoglycan-binding protein n=1 Tax=Saccharothrix xinjiangensis TaxID=204798 RepID=A0ABV9YAK4_9PSEU
MKRLPGVVAAAVLVAGAGGVAAVAVAGQDRVAEVVPDPPGGTATADRGDLVQQEQVGGTLGYAGSYQVTARAGGVLTWLPAPGSVVRHDERVFAVDDRPVPLWRGDTPLWRRVGAGVGKGSDVALVEQNLKDLGLFSGTPDDAFTWTTAAALREWQRAKGLERTGALDVGDVVVLPGEIRVTEVTSVLGAGAGGPVLRASGTGRLVTVEMPVAKQAIAREGAEVEVRLPGGARTKGAVASVGTVARNRDDGTAVIDVLVTLVDPAAAGGLDGAPATVHFTTERREGVITVPVNALLALPGGGYGVEVVRPGGVDLTPVELGLFGNGRVEVTGVAEGAEVRVATS